MNILIAGSDINALLLAEYLKIQNKENDIYITTDTKYDGVNYIGVNIKENDVESISDFIKYNQIEFTITTSPISVINGLGDVLLKEGFSAFVPLSDSARITYLNSVAKKIMYKLKINTPKFGIFDRENLAVDYVRNAKFPIAIQNDLTIFSYQSKVFSTFSQAKKGIKKIFENNNEKIIIENYSDADSVYLYFITDGYNALPLISVEREQYDEYTLIMAPASKISDNILNDILQKVIYPLLDDIKKYADSYIGILGLHAKISNNNYMITEFYNGFQSYDMQAFLPLINDDLLSIMKECAKRQLNRNYFNLTDKYSYTLVFNKNELSKDINEINDDFIESEDNNKYIITSTASTLNSAKNKLLDEIEYFCSDNLKQKINENEQKKELRI